MRNEGEERFVALVSGAVFLASCCACVALVVLISQHAGWWLVLEVPVLISMLLLAVVTWKMLIIDFGLDGPPARR